jgi:K+-transporting ATPase KdpF subunit
MPSHCVSFRRQAMGEPIIGLVVAIGLGLYLLYTLIHPEKF